MSAPKLTEAERNAEIDEEALRRAREAGGTPDEIYRFYLAARAGIYASLGLVDAGRATLRGES